MSAENLVKFFKKIDADNSGSITVEELNGLFAKFDKDGRCWTLSLGRSYISCICCN